MQYYNFASYEYYDCAVAAEGGAYPSPPQAAHCRVCIRACVKSIYVLRRILYVHTLPSAKTDANANDDIRLQAVQTIESRLTAHDTLLITELASTQHWVTHHVSNHSAIHHLCSVADYIDALGLFKPSSSEVSVVTLLPSNSLSSSSSSAYLPSQTPMPLPTSATLQCARQALVLCTSYPTHESLWHYLRRSVASVITASSSSSVMTTIVSSSMSADEIGLVPVGGHAMEYLLWRAQSVSALALFVRKVQPSLKLHTQYLIEL